jgi:hypothetical protein
MGTVCGSSKSGQKKTEQPNAQTSEKANINNPQVIEERVNSPPQSQSPGFSNQGTNAQKQVGTQEQVGA